MRLAGMGRIDIARLVRDGVVTKEEAGAELIERAMRRLLKLEFKTQQQAESDASSDDKALQ